MPVRQGNRGRPGHSPGRMRGPGGGMHGLNGAPPPPRPPIGGGWFGRWHRPYGGRMPGGCNKNFSF